MPTGRKRGMLDIKIPEIRGDNIKEKKVGVARLKPTRYDKSKGPRIGPSLF